MSETIEKRLSDLGVVLPVPAAPAANYVPTVATGRLLFTSGQLNFHDGKLTSTGLVGRDVQIRLLLGDRLVLTKADIAADAKRAVDQFLTLFGSGRPEPRIRLT